MAKCAVCNSEFEAKRATARYCSAKCRAKASRSVTEEPEVSVTPLSVTPEAITEAFGIQIPPRTPQWLKDSPEYGKPNGFDYKARDEYVDFLIRAPIEVLRGNCFIPAWRYLQACGAS